MFQKKRDEEKKVKNKEKYGRYRNVIINFRVTPEEREIINNRIAVSGLTKSDFFINSCIHQKLIVVGNVKTFNEIKSQVAKIYEKICQFEKDKNFDMQTLEALRNISEILYYVYSEKEK